MKNTAILILGILIGIFIGGYLGINLMYDFSMYNIENIINDSTKNIPIQSGNQIITGSNKDQIQQNISNIVKEQQNQIIDHINQKKQDLKDNIKDEVIKFVQKKLDELIGK